MKKISLLLAVMTMMLPLHAQLAKRKTPLSNTLASATPTFKQKRSEVQYFYPVFDNQPTEEGIKIGETEYSKLGSPRLWRGYNLESEVAYEYTYEMDSAARQLKRYYQSPKHAKTLDYIEQYNAFGRVVETQRFMHTGQLMERVVWEYNALGQPMKSTHWDTLQQKIHEVDYDYRDNPYACIEKHHNLKTKERFVVAIAYNEQNMPIEETRYDESEELREKIEIQYDSQSRISEKRFYRDGKNLDVVETFNYNPLNTQMEHAIYTRAGKELIEYSIYKYEFY